MFSLSLLYIRRRVPQFLMSCLPTFCPLSVFLFLFLRQILFHWIWKKINGDTKNLHRLSFWLVFVHIVVFPLVIHISPNFSPVISIRIIRSSFGRCPVDRKRWLPISSPSLNARESKQSTSWKSSIGNSINLSIYSSNQIVHERDRVYVRWILCPSCRNPHRSPSLYLRWSNSNGRILPRELNRSIHWRFLHRFIESFNLSTMIHLLDNSTKMMNLAMQYARHQRPSMSSKDMEDWQIHVKVDYTRLQTLLDHDMCAPLVWIEHFQHLINGNRCQLFDCDYMFNVIEYQQRTESFLLAWMKKKRNDSSSLVEILRP